MTDLEKQLHEALTNVWAVLEKNNLDVEIPMGYRNQVFKVFADYKQKEKRIHRAYILGRKCRLALMKLRII